MATLRPQEEIFYILHNRIYFLYRYERYASVSSPWRPQHKKSSWRIACLQVRGSWASDFTAH